MTVLGSPEAVPFSGGGLRRLEGPVGAGRLPVQVRLRPPVPGGAVPPTSIVLDFARGELLTLAKRAEASVASPAAPTAAAPVEDMSVSEIVAEVRETRVGARARARRDRVQ